MLGCHHYRIELFVFVYDICQDFIEVSREKVRNILEGKEREENHHLCAEPAATFCVKIAKLRNYLPIFVHARCIF